MDGAATHVLRLHSEFESFASVLRNCSNGNLKPEESDILRQYLYETSKRLLRPTMNGHPQASLLEQIAFARAGFLSSEIASLRQALTKLTPSLQRLVTDAFTASLRPTETAASDAIIGWNYSQGVTVVIDKSIRVGGNLSAQGAVGSNISIENSSFASYVNTPLANAAAALENSIIEASPTLGQHKDTFTEAAHEIRELSQASDPKKSKIALLAQGILGVAKTLGEASTPIIRSVDALLALTN